MRTEWRMGRRWIWLALILLVFSLVINATSNYSLAADETSSGTASTGEQKNGVDFLVVHPLLRDGSGW